MPHIVADRPAASVYLEQIRHYGFGRWPSPGPAPSDGDGPAVPMHQQQGIPFLESLRKRMVQAKSLERDSTPPATVLPAYSGYLAQRLAAKRRLMGGACDIDGQRLHRDGRQRCAEDA